MEFVCYVGATSLPHEIGSAQMVGQTSREIASWEVLHRDRRCSHWYAYKIGLNPHEHRMQLIAAQVENERRKFDLEMEESRKRFHLEMAELDAKRESRERGRDRRLTRAAVILGGAAVLAALLAAGPGSPGFIVSLRRAKGGRGPSGAADGQEVAAGRRALDLTHY